MSLNFLRKSCSRTLKYTTFNFTLKRSLTTLGTAHRYCIDLVRTRDNDNFLVGIYLPKDIQRSVLAFRSLSIETALIQDVAHDPQIRSMRYQWWRDVVNDCYSENENTKYNHPVAIMLKQAVIDHKPPKHWLLQIISEREIHSSRNGFQSVKDLEKYADKTSSTLLYLTLSSLGLKDIHADHAVSHIGKASAIVTILRSTMAHYATGATFLPMDILIKHGLSQEDVLEYLMFLNKRREKAKIDEKLFRDIIFELASEAHLHLDKVCKLQKDLPKKSFPALLYSIPQQDYLRRLQKADFRIETPHLRIRSPFLPFRVMKGYWTGKI